jgi:16S rRNA processing protein RimM
MDENLPHLIRVGRVAGAFGVKGEVRITAFTEEPMALVKYKTLLREDGSPGLTVLSGRTQKGAVIAKVQEITTPEEADALRGLFLFVPREILPEPDEDEYYLTDLIGLAAVAPDGTALGQIRSVRDFGAGDLLEIQPPAGQSWFVAFTRENVPEVSLAAGQVVVDRPNEVNEKD